jgi:transcriptional regulator
LQSLNNKITRKTIANETEISVKTIEKTIKEVDNLKYVGRGSNCHWELSE